MPAYSLSAPTLYPELQTNTTTSPFYANNPVSYWCVTGPTVPRDIVKNWIPRYIEGYGGQTTGRAPQIVSNVWPFNGPADGSGFTNDYASRWTMGTKAMALPYGCGLPTSANPYGTIAIMFRFDDMYGGNVGGAGTGYVPLISIGYSSIYNNEQQYSALANANMTTWGIYSTGSAVCMAFQSTQSAIGVTVNQNLPGATLTAGHWYAFAVAASAYNSTPAKLTLQFAMRFYLHDLTTNTRLTTTGSVALTGTCSINSGSATLTTSSSSSGLAIGSYIQIVGDSSAGTYNVTAGGPTSWTVAPVYGGAGNAVAAAATVYPGQVYGSSQGTKYNYTIVNWPFGWDTGWTTGRADLVVAPGGPQAFVGLVKCVGVFNDFWDDTGLWKALPANFNGPGQFDDWVANPYELLSSTYATGGGVTTICNGASGQNSSISATRPVTYPYMTSSSNAPAGTPTGTQVVATGDVAVVVATDTTITFQITRPQATTIAPSGSWVWNFYVSQIRGKGSGGTLALSYTGQQPNFVFTPTAAGPWFVTPIVSDGTNTYTYCETPCALNNFPDTFTCSIGNSFLTTTGNNPMGWFALAMASFGLNCTHFNAGWDSTTSLNWLPSAAAIDVPNWLPSNNLYTIFVNRIAVEIPFLPAGVLYDCFIQLLTNDGITTSPTNYSTIANALLATGNFKRIVFLAADYDPIVHILPQALSQISDSLAIQKSIANGTTIFSIADASMWLSCNQQGLLSGSHPNQYLAVLNGINAATQYMGIVYPSQAVGGGGSGSLTETQSMSLLRHRRRTESGVRLAKMIKSERPRRRR